MRILSISFPLPGRGIDNHNIVNAPAFFDYDAIVVDPMAVSRTIEEVIAGTGELRTGDDQRVANLATSPLVVGLDELLSSRRQQTELLLRRGGLVVTFAAPDVLHHQVAGLPAWRRFSWLPEPDAGTWQTVISPASGRGCETSDPSHPFAPFADYAGSRCSYRGFFVEGDADFQVVARSPGGAALGAEFKVDRGRVVMLPALADPGTGPARAELARVIRQCLADVSEQVTVETEPAWAVAVELPGLTDLEQTEVGAASKLDDARADLEVAELARRRVSDLREAVMG